MSYDIKYEHRNGMVVFCNDVVISKPDYDAIFKLKAFVTDMPSFIWSELLRLKENQNSLTIHYIRPTFKRKQKAFETLRDSEHFKMEVSEILVHNKKKIELKLTEITPEFKSIIHLF